ncbi:uncharacterized protein [Amphiura filiformis]|uniref:uncharacterized protein isoform X1 n=1 Tax=Amphiura filiformis TaxID=82378 RepID=UPI003B217C78
MATIHFFIAFASMLALCQYTFAGCPPGLANNHKRVNGVCSNGYLDCSTNALNTSPLPDTLLDNTEVEDCAGLSESTTSQCPPSGFNSGKSFSNIPSGPWSGCSFCFKMVLILWQTWPANAGTACTRKRQAMGPGSAKAPRYTTIDNDRNIAVEYVSFGEVVEEVVQKIGPDPVIVNYLYTKGDPDCLYPLGGQGRGKTYFAGGAGYKQKGGLISFGQGYQETTLTFGPITNVTEIQLIRPGYGIIGMPGTLRIIPT